MNNEPIDSEESNPIATNLYKIPDDVKNEILMALNMWQSYSSQQDHLMVERSFNALKKPYSSTLAPTNQGISAAIHGSPDKIKNGINDFKAFLDVQIEQAKGDWKNALENIKKAFYSSIGSKF